MKESEMIYVAEDVLGGLLPFSIVGFTGSVKTARWGFYIQDGEYFTKLGNISVHCLIHKYWWNYIQLEQLC